MPRQAGTTVENNFVRGLITEVTGVNSPENSVVDSDNVIFDRRARAKRRPGFEYETDFEVTDLNASTLNVGVISEYLWETVSNISATSFVVVQVANKILFYTASGDTISNQKKTFEIDLLPFKVAVWANSDVINNQASFASGNGKLFITHPFCEPFFVTYDSLTDTVATTNINIQTRDFEGVEDGVVLGDRPATLTVLHKYNLWNQGWWDKCKCFSAIKQTIDAWRNDTRTSRTTDYPGNHDIWWYYKVVYTPGGDNPAQPDIFRNNQPDAMALGNTPAPKGHFIYSAWQTARSVTVDKSGNALGGSVPETSSNGARPSNVAFFYGRVFYAGVRNALQASNIYFTQIIERDEQYGWCYQQNDPSSEKAFDLLPSDGGVIKIPDIVNIIDMRVFGPSLFIFAANGVWSITGSNNSAFKATDYQVQKVSSYPALAKNSIVDVGGTPVWWNDNAIYLLTKSETSITPNVENISQQSIQSFFDELTVDAKANAKGAYNALDGLVYWLYRRAPIEDPADTTRYDSILVMDIVMKSFYPFSVVESPVFLSGIVSVRVSDNNQIFKFLTTGDLQGVTRGLTFSELKNPVHTDWEIETTGVDFFSYFLTGYRIRGELLKLFQTNYLTVFTETDPLSSAYVQGVWDYTNSPDSGRYTNPQQIYATKNYYADYQRVKRKIRGQGYSLQFRFYSEGRLPFVVIGWATLESSNTVP